MTNKTSKEIKEQLQIALAKFKADKEEFNVYYEAYASEAFRLELSIESMEFEESHLLAKLDVLRDRIAIAKEKLDDIDNKGTFLNQKKTDALHDLDVLIHEAEVDNIITDSIVKLATGDRK